MQVKLGDTIHCNRCNEVFQAPKAMERDPFYSQKATRCSTFVACPHCGQTDSHWVFAADLMPTFAGGFDARKRAQRYWLKTN